MSAYIVSKRHIDYLVTLALKCEVWTEDPTRLGALLWEENRASVAHRYSKETELPTPYTYEPYDREEDLNPGFGQKQIHCLNYQSCEHPGWENSQAHDILFRLDNALYFRGLKEKGAAWRYERAPWGVD